jgi:hypothetical protein
MWADIIADKGYVQFSELPGILKIHIAYTYITNLKTPIISKKISA